MKKVLFVGAAVVLALGLFMGRSGLSYVGSAIHGGRELINDRIPVEHKIDAARHEIKNLDGVIVAQMHTIAKEQVAFERLQEQVANEEKDLSAAQVNIMKLKNHLDSGSKTFVYSGKTFDNDQVEANLRQRFETFKVKKDTVTQLREMMKAREQGLLAAKAQLEELRSAKSEMAVQVENLEARHKMLEVAQTANKFVFDDSQLAHCRKLIDEIETKLRVDAKLVEAGPVNVSNIPLESPDVQSDDVSAEVEAYFNTDSEGLVMTAETVK